LADTSPFLLALLNPFRNFQMHPKVLLDFIQKKALAKIFKVSRNLLRSQFFCFGFAAMIKADHARHSELLARVQ